MQGLCSYQRQIPRRRRWTRTMRSAATASTAAPIVICCVWFPIGACREQVVTVWIFETRITVYVIILPGIFWHLLIQLIPTRRPRISIRLGNERLQTLFGRWIKTVHALVELKLGIDPLDVSCNSNTLRVFHVACEFVDRGAKQESNDRYHEHDLKKRKALLIIFHYHLER